MVETAFWIRTRAIANVLDPFRRPVWTPRRITRASVAKAIGEGRLAETPSDRVEARLRYDATARWDYDVARVAYLVVHKALDPISIEVIDPWGTTCLHDGCHRLAAALYRGDPFVPVDYGGYCDAFFERFAPDMRSETITNR